MTEFRRLIVSVMCLLLMLLTVSCSKPTEQEASSASSNIETSVNPERTTSRTESSPSSLESEASPSNAGNYCTTENTGTVEQTFDLSFSDNLKVYDYGQKTVNAYRVKFADFIQFEDSFYTAWIKHSAQIDYLVNWSTGGGFSYSPILKSIEDMQNYDGVPLDFLEFQCSDYDTIKHNIQNVDMVTLKDLDNGEELAQECRIDVNSPILVWNYRIVDFPVEDAVKSFYDVQVEEDPFSKSTVKYAQVRAQYIDGIPVCGEWDNYNECTYDWPGVIEPSRRASTCNMFFPSYSLVNPSDTCQFYIATQRYTAREVIKSDLPVVAPEDCLDEIADAIKYQPSAVRNGKEIHDAWGMNIEVYCMELTYYALDPKPLYQNESEESRNSHVMYLVPTWKVYFTCTDPKTNAIGHGTLVINAATGESIFSSTIPQGTNLELYPDLYREG